MGENGKNGKKEKINFVYNLFFHQKCFQFRFFSDE